MRNFIAGVCAAVFLLPGPAGHAATSGTPSDFLKLLYAHYAPGTPDFNPTGDKADEIFASDLLTLIRNDQHPGEVGKLDHDPVCACQDYDGFKPQSITVTPATGTLVHASVRFNNDKHETVVGFLLIDLNGKWKISDITDPGQPSLRQLLTTK